MRRVKRVNSVKGFTLIELIVVIAIVGVLAAILVPNMIGYVGKSKLSTANSNAKLAYTNAATYCTECEVESCSVTNYVYVDMDLTGGTAGMAYSKDGTELEEALQSHMGGHNGAGYCTIAIGTNNAPERSAWVKDDNDQYVGGYPQPATIAANGVGNGSEWKVHFASATPIQV
ncbi:MAG: type II secretion system protein [Ruminococcus sp.]|nr:type II secretion system protein [Ruminococcus sp.]